MRNSFLNSPDSSLDNYVKRLIKKRRPGNRLLLVNPVQIDLGQFDMETARRRGYYVYPPVGLLFLAASVADMGVDVGILDLNYELLRKTIKDGQFNKNMWKDLLLKRIEEFQPSIIGVSCMFSSLSGYFEEALEFLKDMDRFILLAGGTHASFEYSRLLEAGLCHFAFTRESEDKLPFIMSKLLSLNREEEPCAGVYYRDSESIKETKGVDALPENVPDLRKVYDLIPIEKYCQAGSLNQYSRLIGGDDAFSAVSMNRGCRGYCTFCSVRSLLGKKVRSRSIDSVMDELCYLAKVRGVRHFDWLDDDLLANRKSCFNLFDRMKKEQLNLRWYANNGVIALSLDRPLLKAMVESGCIGFKIGIETGNEEMMKKIRKPTSLNKLLELSVLFEQFPEIFIAGNYIIGFPFERFSQMLDTFIFANKMNIDWSGFYICQPLKGAGEFSNFQMLQDARCKNQGPDNYLPAREIKSGLREENCQIRRGMGIFNLDAAATLSAEQIKEAWFVFGFLTNFINNKNLKPSGRVEKFIGWVRAAMDVYPDDAGMALFLSFAYTIAKNIKQAEEYHKIAEMLHSGSGYWQSRFEQFGLTQALENRITKPEDIFALLSLLWQGMPFSEIDKSCIVK